MLQKQDNLETLSGHTENTDPILETRDEILLDQQRDVIVVFWA